jgi:spore coat protein U-like protein
MARLALILVPFAVAHPAAAQSGRGSATMAVSVEVVPNCTVSAAPLSLAPRPGRPGESTADIVVACGPDEPFTLALDQGSHASSTTRRAFDAVTGRYLAYDIYRDAARSQRWSDGPDSVVSGVTNASGLALFKAFGGMPADQELIAGSYADQVVVTVNF